jgi:hypothetical protein
MKDEKKEMRLVAKGIDFIGVDSSLTQLLVARERQANLFLSIHD